MLFTNKTKCDPRKQIKRSLTCSRLIKPTYRISGIFMVTILFMVLALAPLKSVQAEDNLSTVSSMMEQNSAHFKSFFSHEQSKAIRNIMGVARAVYLSPEVTTAKGVYLGSGLANTELSDIKKYNQAVYGADYDIAAILSKEGGEFKAANGLRMHLKKAVKQSWAE